MAQKARKAVKATRQAKPATRLVPAEPDRVKPPLDATAVRVAAMRELMRFVSADDRDNRDTFQFPHREHIQRNSGIATPVEYFVGNMLLLGQSWVSIMLALEGVTSNMMLGALVRIAAGQQSPEWSKEHVIPADFFQEEA